MTDIKLPKLPEHGIDGYTARQMQEYAMSAVRANMLQWNSYLPPAELSDETLIAYSPNGMDLINALHLRHSMIGGRCPYTHWMHIKSPIERNAVPDSEGGK